MIRRLLFILLPLLVFGAGVLWAQADSVNAYLDRGRALSKAEKLDQALPYFLLALELGEKKFGTDSPSVIPILNDLAATYATRDDFGDAEPLFERSLKIQEGALSRYRSGIARTLNQLGAIYEATARPDRAREAYTRVLAHLQNGLGAGNPSVQTARLRLAKLERLPPPPVLATVTPAPIPTAPIPTAPTPTAPTPTAPIPTAATPSAPTAVAAPQVETTRTTAGYQIHISSVRRTGEAPDEWRRLQQTYPTLLGGLDLTVVRIDLGTRRGVWYRVLGGVLARAEARRRCANFTRRGIWCAVRRGATAPPDVRVAAEVPSVVAPESVAPPAGANDYRIHLTSIRREANAAAEWRRLQRLFRVLLADLDVSIMRADLGAERGVWYRIQGGPLARAEARTRCAFFAAQKHWCQVVPPLGPSSQNNQRFLALRVRRRDSAETRGTRRPRPAPNPDPGARREQSNTKGT